MSCTLESEGSCMRCIFAVSMLAGPVCLADLPLISWGPASDWVSTTVTSPRFESDSASIPLDLETIPLTPTTGYAGLPIFGGVQLGGSLSLTALRIFNDHAVFGLENGIAHDVLDLRTLDPTPSPDGLMTVLLMWPADPPAAGWDRPVSLLGVDQLSYTGGYSQNTVMEAWFVLRHRTQSGYSFIISPTSITGARLADNGGTHTVDATAASWYSYDPTTASGLNSIQPGPALESPDLGILSLTHAGLLVRLSAKETESVLSLYRFSATTAPWRPSPPFRALFNNDTGNVRIYAMENPGGTPSVFAPQSFSADKLIRSIDEVAEAGIDAYMLSPFATFVPLWQSEIVRPSDHYAWWRYAHPRIDFNPPRDLDPIGYYMDPDDPEAPRGDVMRVFVERCQQLGVPAIASIRLNDHHYIEDMDARPGLWNISNGGAIANDYWRYTHPQYRLARAELSSRPEYRRKLASDSGLSATLSAARSATVLNWSIPEVRMRMLGFIGEIIGKYPGLDGVELDFVRHGNHFPASLPVAERTAIINDFISRVRERLDAQGQLDQRRRWLSARVFGLNSALDLRGFDVAAMAAAGVDLFVFTSSSSTHTVQQGQNLDTLRARLRQAAPEVKAYVEMTEQVATPTDQSGQLLEWLNTRQQLATTMHLAYGPTQGMDGFSLFNFAYYRDSSQSALPLDNPPFDMILPLKDPAVVAAMPQHYFVTRTLNSTGSPSARSFTLILRRPGQPATAWTSPARLRLHSADPLSPDLGPGTIMVTMNNSVTSSIALTETTDISEPYTDSAGRPQFRLPIPINDHTRVRAWIVPADKLAEGTNSFRVINQSSPQVPATFHYVDLIIP
jgi:hypothetical protein